MNWAESHQSVKPGRLFYVSPFVRKFSNHYLACLSSPRCYSLMRLPYHCFASPAQLIEVKLSHDRIMPSSESSDRNRPQNMLDVLFQHDLDGRVPIIMLQSVLRGLMISQDSAIGFSISRFSYH